MIKGELGYTSSVFVLGRLSIGERRGGGTICLVYVVSLLTLSY